MKQLFLSIGTAFPLLCLLAAPVMASAPPSLDPGRELRRSPVVQVFEKTRDAVVNIACVQVVQQAPGIEDLFNHFLDRRLRPDSRVPQQEIIGVGSGFVLHPDGYVVTNAHVVMKTVDQRVIFSDGSEYKARPVAIHSDNDLAVLKIDAGRPVPSLKLGTSQDLMIGETVIAIGNPLGYHHTLTTGVISALDRTLQFPGNVEYTGLIQTDASINPGSSGGPLFNVLGELIGVNTAIRGDAENIGFAIPVDQLRTTLPSMLSLERLKRVRVGMHVTGYPVPQVAEVHDGSPAQAAGIRVGDRLLDIDGRPVRQDVDFYFHLLSKEAGNSVSLRLERNGREISTVLTLRAIPVPDGARLALERFGMKIVPLPPNLARALELDGGLVVDKVEQGSEADRAGIEPGRVILNIAGDFPQDLDQLGLILENIRTGEIVLFHTWQLDRRGNRILIRAYTTPLKAR
jgi:serine protease Do